RLDAVAAAEQREAGAIDPDGGLDHHRHEALAALLLDHREVAAGELRVAREIPVAAVVHALDLLPPEREAELDVGGGVGLVRQPLRLVRAHGRRGVAEAEPVVEGDALGEPVLEPLLPLAAVDEELELGLLELARAEREVARVDLVAERLADLGDPE